MSDLEKTIIGLAEECLKEVKVFSGIPNDKKTDFEKSALEYSLARFIQIVKIPLIEKNGLSEEARNILLNLSEYIKPINNSKT